MSPTEVLQAWHDAVNAHDVDAAVELCAADVAVGGPRGTGRGHEVVRAWLVRSGIELRPQHDLVVTDGHAVVHEKARWRTTDDAPVQLRDGSEHDTWVVFGVTGGLVTAVRRFETEEDALRDATAPEAPTISTTAGDGPAGLARVDQRVLVEVVANAFLSYERSTDAEVDPDWAVTVTESLAAILARLSADGRAEFTAQLDVLASGLPDDSSYDGWRDFYRGLPTVLGWA